MTGVTDDAALMYRPSTRDELLGLLADLGEDAKVLAGGTAFTILRKAGLLRPGHIVSLAAVEGLAGITHAEGHLSVGAATRLRAVERSGEVRAHQPVLAAALGLVANLRVRNVATLGGNLAEADPTSDPPAVLTALDAVAHLASRDEERQVPVPAFFTGYFETAVRCGEIVSHVVIPDLAPSWAGSYVKFLSRSTEDRTCVGVAAFADVGEDGTFRGIRVTAVGVGPVPLRLREVEDATVGAPVTAETLNRVAGSYVDAADPVSDLRGTADYRRRVLAALVPDAVMRAVRRTDDAVFA